MGGVVRELRRVADKLNQTVKELRWRLQDRGPETCEELFVVRNLADQLHAAAGRLGAVEEPPEASSEKPTVRIRPVQP